MKWTFYKILLTSLMMLLLGGCSNYDDQIADLQNSIDNINNTHIASITQQIDAINQSIPELEALSSETQKYITTLQSSVSSLEDEIATINSKITELKTAFDNEILDSSGSMSDEVENAIEGSKTEMLEELEGVKAQITSQIAQISTTIATLESKDSELEEKITTLRSYVNEENQKNKDWATATFATIAQYNSIVEDIATIKVSITTLNNSIEEIETELIRKFTADIELAVESLKNDYIAEIASEITTSYTAAIESSKNDITSAYTEAISVAISTLELSMKGWVNEKLTGYYTMAQMDAKLTILKTELEEDLETHGDEVASIKTKIAQQEKDIAEFETKLAELNNEMETAYTTAINNAITTLNGKIGDELDTINSSIEALTDRVDDIEDEVSAIKILIYGIQEDVAGIMARVQSVSFIPEYSDGNATMYYTNSAGVITPGFATISFEVRPKTSVEELVKVWDRALSVKALYTQTRATSGEFVELTIESVQAEDGVLKLVVSGSALGDEYFHSELSASVRLEISDGSTSLTSEYINMIPQTTNTVYIPDENFKAYLTSNFDTNSDGEISLGEANGITHIEMSQPLLRAESLLGIEYFKNLEVLEASYNKLTSLNLTSNKKLKVVDVSNNNISSLKLPASVIDLNVNDNGLSALDLSKNQDIEKLECSDNYLTEIDVRNLENLSSLICANNQISAIVLSESTKLQTLGCEGNTISELELSNCPELRELKCSGNDISELDLTANSNLESIDCSYNSIGELYASTLNSLTTLNCSNNPTLSRLWLRDESHQASINLIKDAITIVFYNNGGLVIKDENLKTYLLQNYDFDNDGNISIAEAEDIMTINIPNKGITTLDGIEVCRNLITLNCSNNDIAEMDLSMFTKLRTLTCNGNPIENLNIDNCTSLMQLNLISPTTNAISGDCIKINDYEESAIFEISMNNTRYSGFHFISSSIISSLKFHGDLTDIKVNSNPSLNTIDLSAFTDLISLDLQHCKLQSLDISQNRDLTTLLCNNNELTAINLTQNSSIERLDVSSNKLSILNTRHNKNLTELNCSDNSAISLLYLNDNTQLKELTAEGIGISDIDLSSCILLSKAKLQDNATLRTITVWDEILQGEHNPLILYDYNKETNLINLSGVNSNDFEDYSVGDFALDGYGGVIISASSSSITMMTSDEGYGDREEIILWARDYGLTDEWSLPAKESWMLNCLLTNIDTIDQSLESKGFRKVKRTDVYYWTSTEWDGILTNYIREYYTYGFYYSQISYNHHKVTISRYARAFKTITR